MIIYKQKARQQYTVLFAFNSDKSKIALIKKNRPDWQKGFYNGIGGKVEENETFVQAATREFFEEAGIVIDNEYYFARVVCPNSIIYFFYAILTEEEFNQITSKTDEKIEKFTRREFNILQDLCIKPAYWLANILFTDDFVKFIEIDYLIDESR